MILIRFKSSGLWVNNQDVGKKDTHYVKYNYT